MRTVYIDLLFLINFSMDLLCMLLVSKLLCRRLNGARAAAGAVIGGAYSVAALFLPALPIPPLIPNALCCVIMCFIAFAQKGDGARRFAAVVLTYLLASMLLGGIMTASFNLLNRADVSLDSAESNDIPPWLMISVGISSLLAARVGGGFLKRRASHRTARVTVVFGNKEVGFEAMYDSGNLLRDGISGRPVIVADSRHAKELIGISHPPEARDVATFDSHLAKSTVLIPYHTASGCKTMVAIRPQRLLISEKGRTREVDALVGFADASTVIEGCSALIPYELI